MNALILLTEGSASPFLKDNEHFLNPLEWVERNNTELEFPYGSLKSGKSGSNQSLNDFIASKDNMTSASTSSFKSSIHQAQQVQHAPKPSDVNYKKWYGIPNQYHTKADEKRSKCQHLHYVDYTHDHQNAKYIPAIFTPRSGKSTDFNFGIAR
jgi:hypothetical protein